TVLNLPRTLALTATMIGSVFNASTIRLAGGLSDRLGRRPVYAAGALLAALWAFGLFMLANRANDVSVVVAVVIGYVIHGLMFAPQASFRTEQFPTRVRYAGSSLAYTLAGIVGGAFAALIMASLFQEYRNTIGISWYIVGAVCLTFVAL